MTKKIESILNQEEFTKSDLIQLMKIEDKEDLELLFKKAYEIKSKYVGRKVYYRGLIEISNRCIKNCNYCGIRRDNKKVERFSMSKDEIMKSVKWIYENNYASLALQSGERQDKEFVDFIEDLIKEIKTLSNGKLGITLSLGEQSKETYQRWFDAGAHRYLLRIESTNLDIYNKLHPMDNKHTFEVRKRCLEYLREVGYQVGTGVMIGLPNQTEEDLVNDILFYKEMDIDMIGMGPYILHRDTPLGKEWENVVRSEEKRVELGLKMIAITRILLKDVNIAATTALQGLDPNGREKGLLAGANILMPTATALEHKGKYLLYNNKPGIKDSVEKAKEDMDKKVKSIGDEIVYGAWGDSLHFKNK
ncbi:[FeFe] hydrogenase H-cluster radical SAM maturase HydE [Fusobacterium sp.]|uniref:[FeFe] hydrogenase H-cluster radical SAM maturase HydE n=1 Tax=Fusobacterium sp. TaxID=68766 RepID=UPI00262BBA1E|nr:[FeFe] hydrogenase H-cluster radical SAM maturase HydE [Fusobacterium sp.]